MTKEQKEELKQLKEEYSSFAYDFPYYELDLTLETGSTLGYLNCLLKYDINITTEEFNNLKNEIKNEMKNF